MELRKIARNGHSWHVTLPRKLVKALNLGPGSVVAIELLEDCLVISRAVASQALLVRPRVQKGRPDD